MITLLDPALRNNRNQKSTNLGDLIISEAVTSNLQKLFPNEEIKRISTHSPLSKKHYASMKESTHIFLGGSNILSSHLLKYNQWKFAKKFNLELFSPKMRDIILLGVGWWQYQDKPDFITKRFYNRVFSDQRIHSVRDSYTKEKLVSIGFNNVTNTTCPTLWELNNCQIDRKSTTTNHVVFTLTDYNPNPKDDETMILLLLDYFNELTFFSQGSLDEEYICSLPVYKKNKDRIKIISSINHYKDILSSNDLVYIGTRLHGGIFALKNGVDSLIISIDNRAEEIKKDINLGVVERGQNQKIKSWIEQKTDWGSIQLDEEAINHWKNQFS